ncbi:hypothetical protein Vadar_010222 [Vaccinium darrowii]|uniref:Uncharacterized protein n=1 Tax=Vaccinium darrowii TaxID=229202 RepID=A0ACB7Z493_9ERIC|nr:hypothetical protein Vadar_010222 [Vaccinium darrowii]
MYIQPNPICPPQILLPGSPPFLLLAASAHLQSQCWMDRLLAVRLGVLRLLWFFGGLCTGGVWWAAAAGGGVVGVGLIIPMYSTVLCSSTVRPQWHHRDDSGNATSITAPQLVWSANWDQNEQDSLNTTPILLAQTPGGPQSASSTHTSYQTLGVQPSIQSQPSHLPVLSYPPSQPPALAYQFPPQQVYPTSYNGKNINNRSNQRFNRNQSSQPHYSMTQNNSGGCQICGKTNHLAYSCYHRQNLAYRPNNRPGGNQGFNGNHSFGNQGFNGNQGFGNQGFSGYNGNFGRGNQGINAPSYHNSSGPVMQPVAPWFLDSAVHNTPLSPAAAPSSSLSAPSTTTVPSPHITQLGTLKFTSNGDLILEDVDGDMVWSTNTRGKSVTSLRFTEFGNLVLLDKNNATVWQSLDHPTDSLLIWQKLVSGQKLIASTSLSDFSRGLFSLSVQDVSFIGYLEANPPLIYYESILVGFQNFMNSKEAYVAFENRSFNGQNIPLGLTAQFMRLEPNGHLKVYEWDEAGDKWKTVADLLTSDIGDCGYPMVCGKYGICSNGQCGCLLGSSNGTGNFKKINSNQPNLGCSLVTPMTCNYSQYHSLLELKNTSYFNLNSQHYNELDEKTGLEDCKNACFRNCSCKGALFVYGSFNFPLKRGCLFLSDVFSLVNKEGGSNKVSVFLKVQNSPTEQSSLPLKKSRSGTIILGSSLGALFGVCLLVGSCISVFKKRREPEELDDEFYVDKVMEMPTRFSYDDLKTSTSDFNNKLGEGGFGSQPEEEMHLLRLVERKAEEGQLLDMVDKYNIDMQLHITEVAEMMNVALWCLQSDYQRLPSMTVVVQVLEGFVTVPEKFGL